MRFKNRYILVEMMWEDGKVDEGVTAVDLFKALKESVALNFGDWGAGTQQTALTCKYWHALTNMAIFRCARDNAKLVLASLALLRLIRGRVVTCNTIHVAGTIRSCQETTIRHHQAALAKLLLSPTTPAAVKQKAETASQSAAAPEEIMALAE
jgi:ribonuclease P/MRP protein subunit POP5